VGRAYADRASTVHTRRSGSQPLGFALDDEGIAAEHELIARARVGDLARPQL
jgi:hypothetical protein